MTNRDPMNYTDMLTTEEADAVMTGMFHTMTANAAGHTGSAPDISSSNVGISSSSIGIIDGQTFTTSDHTTILPIVGTQWPIGNANPFAGQHFPLGQPFAQPLVPYNPFTPLDPFINPPQTIQHNELKPEEIIMFLEGLNLIPEKELEKIREALKPKKEIKTLDRFDDLIL